MKANVLSGGEIRGGGGGEKGKYLVHGKNVLNAQFSILRPFCYIMLRSGLILALLPPDVIISCLYMREYEKIECVTRDCWPPCSPQDLNSKANKVSLAVEERRGSGWGQR